MIYWSSRFIGSWLGGMEGLGGGGVFHVRYTRNGSKTCGGAELGRAGEATERSGSASI